MCVVRHPDDDDDDDDDVICTMYTYTEYIMQCENAHAIRGHAIAY